MTGIRKALVTAVVVVAVALGIVSVSDAVDAHPNPAATYVG